jgi:hypothetical protein
MWSLHPFSRLCNGVAFRRMAGYEDIPERSAAALGSADLWSWLLSSSKGEPVAALLRL